MGGCEAELDNTAPRGTSAEKGAKETRRQVRAGLWRRFGAASIAPPPPEHSARLRGSRLFRIHSALARRSFSVMTRSFWSCATATARSRGPSRSPSWSTFWSIHGTSMACTTSLSLAWIRTSTSSRRLSDRGRGAASRGCNSTF